MTHMRFVAAALAFILAAPALAVAQPSLTGDWVVTLTGPQGTRDLNAKLKQDGEKLTGSVVTQRGEMPLDGTVAGPDVKLLWKANVQGQEFAITLTGKLDGEAIRGKADFGGMMEGEWSARRGTVAPAAVSPTPPASSSTPVAGATPAADFAGDWDITFKTFAGEYTGKATVKQEGDKVSGVAANQMGSQPLTGTVEGKTVKMSFISKTTGGDVPVSLVGDIDGETIAGKAEIGGLIGEWTAKRAKK